MLPLGPNSPLRLNGHASPPASKSLAARIAPLVVPLVVALFLALRRPTPSPSPSTLHGAPLRPVSGCADPLLTTLEPRERAAILVLVRHSDLAQLVPTLLNFEHQFNSRFRYPYVLLSSPDEGPLPPPFRAAVARALPDGAETRWGVVPEAHWRIPPHLDPESVRRGFREQEARGVQYAGREGYHHMVRWYAGLWARHELLEPYDWFWRLEPGVTFFCSITYDPFRFLSQHGKLYGFVITVVENLNTVPSLFAAVKRHLAERGIQPRGALWRFLMRRDEHTGDETFGGCHFWTNMEIGDLRFFRSEAYEEFFRALDAEGGFYTERWGDAPVRALALGALASLKDIHYFEDLGYQHDWFFHCPARSTRATGVRGRGRGGDDGVVGCGCECPREGDRQGRSEGQETVDMDTDWRFSCLEQWTAAVRDSQPT